MIVLDTNIVSALMSPGPSSIEPWLAGVHPAELFITTITRAEIRYGIERLPGGRRREELSDLADRFFQRAAERVLAFDSAAADRYGEIAARREREGRRISVPDGQISAIASVHRATVATRNVRDFAGTGVGVIDPFSTGSV